MADWQPQKHGVQRVRRDSARREVIGVGDAVDKIKVGDMISAPFNVACGHCRNCEEGLTNYCLRANEPGIAGAAYGFADMGPWPSEPFGRESPRSRSDDS